jgi:hypothetical protein
MLLAVHRRGVTSGGVPCPTRPRDVYSGAQTAVDKLQLQALILRREALDAQPTFLLRAAHRVLAPDALSVALPRNARRSASMANCAKGVQNSI